MGAGLSLCVPGFIAGHRYQGDLVATGRANPHTFLNNISINPGSSTEAIVLFDVPVGKQLQIVERRDSYLLHRHLRLGQVGPTRQPWWQRRPQG